MSTNNGGPAFPANHFDLAEHEHGMSLRDYFAAAASEEDINAAASCIANVDTVLRDPATGYCNVVHGRPADWRQLARYLHADAMLRAREVTA